MDNIRPAARHLGALMRARVDKCMASKRESINFSVSHEQARKGIRWMPWCQMPKKDAVHCEKPW